MAVDVHDPVAELTPEELAELDRVVRSEWPSSLDRQWDDYMTNMGRGNLDDPYEPSKQSIRRQVARTIIEGRSHP
ncbi:MAG TPA: hypothetical protein VJB60_01630 [Candidatus Peribacterales bacterium]|nr:hypothetical protein [Candidatus Peribacterales bacterium]